MADRLKPLHYAILGHFLDGLPDTAEGVVAALSPRYAGYKLLTREDVEETLATACENGLLDEVGCDLDGRGELRISYQVSSFGREMMERYL